MKKPINYEEAVNKLEDIIRRLEEGELSLEQSIQLFTEGMELVKTCNKYLDQAEEKIKILIDNKLEDFIPTQE